MLGWGITGAGVKPPSGITNPSLRWVIVFSRIIRPLGRIITGPALSCQSQTLRLVEEALDGRLELLGEGGDVAPPDAGAGLTGRGHDRLADDDDHLRQPGQLAAPAEDPLAAADADRHDRHAHAGGDEGHAVVQV